MSKSSTKFNFKAPGPTSPEDIKLARKYQQACIEEMPCMLPECDREVPKGSPAPFCCPSHKRQWQGLQKKKAKGWDDLPWWERTNESCVTWWLMSKDWEKRLLDWGKKKWGDRGVDNLQCCLRVPNNKKLAEDDRRYRDTKSDSSS